MVRTPVGIGLGEAGAVAIEEIAAFAPDEDSGLVLRMRGHDVAGVEHRVDVVSSEDLRDGTDLTLVVAFRLAGFEMANRPRSLVADAHDGQVSDGRDIDGCEAAQRCGRHPFVGSVGAERFGQLVVRWQAAEESTAGVGVDVHPRSVVRGRRCCHQQMVVLRPVA